MKLTKQKTQMKRAKDSSQIEKLQDTIRVQKYVKVAITDISGHETVKKGKQVSIQEAVGDILSLGVQAWDNLNPGKLKQEIREKFGLS